MRKTQNDDNIYVVEKMLRKKKFGIKWRNRVKWLGYDVEENTRVDYEDLCSSEHEFWKAGSDMTWSFSG